MCYTFSADCSQTGVEGHRGDVPSRGYVLSGVTSFTLTNIMMVCFIMVGMKQILDRLGTSFLHTTGLHFFTRLTHALPLALLVCPLTRWRHSHTLPHTYATLVTLCLVTVNQMFMFFPPIYLKVSLLRSDNRIFDRHIIKMFGKRHLIGSTNEWYRKMLPGLKPG